MALFAQAGCILKVDMCCAACMGKTLEVLSSIIGVFNVDIDGIRGLVKVFGEVDPNVLLKAIASTGRHAKVIRINFKHPSWSHSYHTGTLDYSHNYPIGACGSALGYMANDYPFRHSTGQVFGLPPHHHAPIGANFGAVFGGGNFFGYGGNW